MLTRSTESLTIIRLKIAVWILALLLSAVIAIFLYLFFKDNAGLPFVGKVHNLTAKESIQWYRDQFSTTKKTRVVLYNAADINNYVTQIFPNDTLELKGDPTCGACKWMVGFYFMRTRNQDDNKRNDFYVIPTLVDFTDPKRPVPYDLLDPQKEFAYKLKPSSKGNADSLAYDTGHIWP